MKKALSVLLALCLAFCLCVPAFAVDDAPLVECALVNNQTYIRLSEAVTDTAADFYVEGISDTPSIHVTVDPSQVQIVRRERLEVVLDFSMLQDETQHKATSTYSLILHGLILADGSCTDITVLEGQFGHAFSGRYFDADPDNILYWKTTSPPYEHYVAVGTVWTLHVDEDALYGDEYLNAHIERSIDGAEPQIEGDTYTFDTVGDCVITFRCCGDFCVSSTTVHVLSKPDMKRMLISTLPFEAFGYGMGVGYWLGPWWLPISLPLGVLHAVAKCIVILFA